MRLFLTLSKIAAFLIFLAGVRQIQGQIMDLATPKTNASNLPTCDVKPRSIHDGDTLRVLCNDQETKIS